MLATEVHLASQVRLASIERRTERQTDGRADEWTDAQADRHTDRPLTNKTAGQMDGQA